MPTLSIEQKFEYIIESKINGQNKQAECLFKALTKKERTEFLSYLADQVETECNGNTIYYQLLKHCIELIY